MDSELTTERLLLRPWQATEAERLFEIRGNPEVAKWLGDPAPWESVDVAVANIENWATGLEAAGPLGTWAIVPKAGGRVAGSLNLSALPDSSEVHIGWNLHPDSTGHGYSAEAAAAVLQFALESGVRRVWALMWPTNHASAKVASAAGMKDLGVRRDRWYGTDQDPLSRMFRLDRH